MMPETFEDLFESAAMMYAAPDWRAAARDVTAVLGAPSFTDGAGWAAWPELKLSDETTGPAWSLLAKTRDLDAVIARASELEWAVGEQSVGGHETRVRLTAPSGLAVIAYSPLS